MPSRMLRVLVCLLVLVGRIEVHCRTHLYLKECGSNPMNDMHQLSMRTGRTLTRVLMLLRNLNETAYKSLAEQIQSYAACVGLVDTGYFKKRSSPHDTTQETLKGKASYEVTHSSGGGQKLLGPIITKALILAQMTQDTPMVERNDKWLKEAVPIGQKGEVFNEETGVDENRGKPFNIGQADDSSSVRGFFLRDSLDALKRMLVENPDIQMEQDMTSEDTSRDRAILANALFSRPVERVDDGWVEKADDYDNTSADQVSSILQTLQKTREVI